MKQTNYIFKDISNLNEFLNSEKTKEYACQSESILVQIFVSTPFEHDISLLKSINTTIMDNLSNAVIVGISSINAIYDGETVDYDCIISFTFFESTKVKSLAIKCEEQDEEKSGDKLADIILDSFSDIKAVMLFIPVFGLRNDLFISSMTKKLDGIKIFGGAPCRPFDNTQIPEIIFDGEHIENVNIVAVVFSSKHLKVESQTYIGWEPLSKEMICTDVMNGNIIKEIDGISPLAMYNKYLGTKDNDLKFMNALEFPLYAKINDTPVLRVACQCFDDGSIAAVGPFKNGDKIRIAYGDPKIIVKNAAVLHQKMKAFNPEAIFIYSCAIRKIFMKDDINLEIKPFQAIAPTIGAYTCGELCGIGEDTYWREMSLVAVGMKENDIENTNYSCDDKKDTGEIEIEKLSQTTLISRLVHFTRAVVSDLEDANKRLEIISTTDSLTGLYNRGKIDEILKAEIDSLDINSDISLILLDIDMFKLVNDNFGHHIGDVVLKGVADIINENLGNTDSVGRWGGEEFLIILRDTNLDEAYVLAEKIRLAINNKDFEIAGRISASFGVMQVSDTDDETKALNRVDAALYMAKNTGRNKIAVL